ncbi:type III pantothenate kinase [Rheinheimera sp.]|uniref:type III pantothenate kinase n=1 Tax=Rheinheimera sp. TaxID=1869214 RepID=UPI00307EAD0B
MHLLIDQGNSRTKACLYKEGVFTDVVLSELTPTDWLSIKQGLIGSVAAAEQQQQLQSLLPASLAVRWLRSTAQAFGISNSYQQPEKLGVDRWLAILGAAALYPNQSLLVIDAGTAVTMDWLSADGVHAGGWILAGLHTQQRILVSATAQVEAAALSLHPLQPGTSTTAAVAEGAKAAVLGAVQQAIQLRRIERVVLTGGDGAFIQQQLNNNAVLLEPKLIFYGLARFIDNN